MIVSLIDIFAILLIFVIVSTTFKKEQPAVKIKLPESKTTYRMEDGEGAVVLTIGVNEEMYLGAKKIDLAGLRTAVQEMLRQESRPRLAISADENVPVKAMFAVWDVLQEAGVKGDLTAFTSPKK
jgi:biopolymer transport protein ExbD